MLHEEITFDILGQRPFSISQLRTFSRCPRAYELQYLMEPRTPVLDMGAMVWFGKIIQRIIQRAYHGVPLSEGHVQVWQQECGPMFDELQQWFDLDAEQKESGSATSNARKRWNEDNPLFAHLTEQIETFQREQLNEWSWSERYPL
ncbi:MAG: hypothetical protein NVSMB38_40430 [Ktedonobacteraceae bacterium]